MTKERKFSLSQAAHQRLKNKHFKQWGKASSRVAGNYHQEVLLAQKEAGRILSKAEKKKIFTDFQRYERERNSR